MSDSMTPSEPESSLDPHQLYSTEFTGPTLIHTSVFLVISGLVTILVSIIVLGVTVGISYLPGMKHASMLDLAKQPVLSVLAQALAYLVALIIAAIIFSEWWQRSMADGIEWNWQQMHRRIYMFLFAGLLMGLAADLASTGMPVPKNLPVDDFFRNAGGVWVIAIFGTTLGPLFEEVTFRGFLYPSLARAWDWSAARMRLEPMQLENLSTPANPAKFSIAAMVVSTILTSICFAAIHAPQIGYSIPVLCLLFSVSVVLTIVRITAKSVAASTLVHAGYNLWNFVLMFFVTGGFRHLDKLRS